MAVWIDPETAPLMWRWFHEMLPKIGSRPITKIGVARIGASAMLAGSMSVATSVALDCQPYLSWDADGPTLLESAATAHLKFWSDFGGNYLGEDVAAALRTYVDFAQRLCAAVT
jgi:hypothetical protein